MNVVRRFARIRGQVVEVTLPGAVPPTRGRPLDHLVDRDIPDLEREGPWRAPWPAVGEEPKALRLMGARERADLLACAAEWTFASPNPAVRQGGALLLNALRSHLDGEPIGRALGLEPAAGLIARREIELAQRDKLLRHVRSAVPDWVELSARQAAVHMLASFERYRATHPQSDAPCRLTAPATEPAATWWRLRRLNLKVQMPGHEQLAAILDRQA